MAAREGIAKRAGVMLTLLAACAVAWPSTAGARVALSCDDAADAVSVDFTDPGLQARVSAAYFDAPGAGDQVGYRCKGKRAGGKPAFGSGICTNADNDWQSLQIRSRGTAGST